MDRTHRTRPARPVSALAALALAAVTLTACGGTADEPEVTAESPSPTAASATPSQEPSEKPSGKPSEKPSEEPAGAGAEVTIEGGTVKPLAQSVEVGVGEPVTLRVTSDRAGELHVHSTPEQYHDIAPGRTSITMTFDKPGAVDVEEHDTGALVLRVLVK